jgi:SPP1 family predicted phage head-tail adaptor
MRTQTFEPTTNIGALRHRVQLQARQAVVDDFGEPVPNWTTLATVWAHVELMGGRELFAAQQIFPEANASITIRYRSGIDTTMRVLWGSRAFDIVHATDIDERRRVLELTAIEKPAGRET